MSPSAPLQERNVVTAFLRREGRILILRRSDRVGSYQGRWAAVSGYLEDPTPLEQALREIGEETGLVPEQLRLAAEAPAIEVPDESLGIRWRVHPFLFDLLSPESAIRLDWEHLEVLWIAPAELADYETVPALAQALEACLTKDQPHG